MWRTIISLSFIVSLHSYHVSLFHKNARTLQSKATFSNQLTSYLHPQLANIPKTIVSSFQISSSLLLSEKQEVIAQGLPDRTTFQDFFERVTFNPNAPVKLTKSGKPVKSKKAEITLDQMLQYDVIQKLVDDALIAMEDVNDLWISSTGEASGLDVDEAYEFLCMVCDLPDLEDQQYFEAEYKKLVGSMDAGVSFMKFLGWSDLQDMLKVEALTMDDVNTIWNQVTNNDLDGVLKLKDFIKLNFLLDDFIEENESINTGDDDDEDDEHIDVWTASFDPESVFESSSLHEIQTFWKLNVDGDTGFLSRSSFMGWKDIIDLVEEGIASTSDLDMVWQEGITYLSNKGGDHIDYDTFLRINVRLDLMIDAKDDDDDVSAEIYYAKVFRAISSNPSVLSLSDLFKWSELQDLIDYSVISTKTLVQLYEQMPMTVDPNNSDAKGISIQSFIALITMLDVMIDKPSSSSSSTIVSAVPSMLLYEEARAMPAERELKIGSLNSNKKYNGKDNNINDEAIVTELSAKVLSSTSSYMISGEFHDNLSTLYNLAKQQPRGGVSPPAEDIEMKLLDFAMAVVEKAPKLADMNLDIIRTMMIGKWRMIYSNSEMFRFYNGVTGFANVFPATSFHGLTVEYMSDGHLNEAKYDEELKTPLGSSTATVYANWDLMKETSFITREMHEKSIIARGYSTKVTMGAREYKAEENWKSLRTLAMNEVVYVDKDHLIMRNAGTSRVFFVLERI